MNFDYTIRLDNLIEQIVDQPKAYGEQVKLLAAALQEQHSAELDLKVLEAKTILEVKRNPTNYGVLKVTEQVADALVDADAKVIGARERVLEAKALVQALRTVVDTLEVKRSSLNKLADLAAAGFIGTTAIQTK